MAVEIREEPLTRVVEHAGVSIAFEVRSVLLQDPDAGSGDIRFVELPVDPPWRKDYDAIPGAHPTAWPRMFDTSTWRLLSAWSEGRRIGGAVVVHDAPDLHMLEGRSDLALVWDLRVAPEHRGRGVGAALMETAERWASERGCREVRVETQNINVPACRLYQALGYRLLRTDPDAYPDFPDEIQLVWTKRLQPDRG